MSSRFALYLLPLALLASCETSQPEKRYHLSSYSGMEEKAGVLGNKAMVKQADAKSFEKYERVIIEDVKVYSPKDKKENKKYASREEAEKMAERFEDILEEELGKHFEVTRYRSYKTLTVRAAITELRPSQPELFAVNYLPYAGIAATGLKMASKDKETLGAGSVSMELEVLDSRSRRQLFAMVDQLKGSKIQIGGLEKWGQADGAMRMWARKTLRGVQGKSVMSQPAEKAEQPSRKAPPKKKEKDGEKKGLFSGKKED